MRLRNPNTRLTWIITGTALLLSLIGSGVIAHRDINELQQSHHALAQGLIRQLARAGHLAVLAHDRPELVEIAHAVLATDAVLGSVTILRADGDVAAEVTQPAQTPELIDHWAARGAKMLGRHKIQMRYASQIPPAGEGSLLDPFGTPRADIGQATLRLSSAQYTRELAHSFYSATLLWLALFLTLVGTGYGIAWLAALPMLRLGRRLSALTGDDAATHPVPGNYAEIERSLAVIRQRLSHSEDRARVATEALHGQAQQLEMARDHARNAARMRADLVAGMSHELRTPLTAILGHTDLLARSQLDKRQIEYVATVRKSARNLLNLINDVLEWSGLEAGKSNPNEVGINLAETVEDTMTLLAPLAFEKDLELAHMIYQDVPVRLRGDPQRFQQVLTNLVSNAIKFTEQGGITIRIMLEDEDDNAVTIRVSVADTGPGIAQHAQTRLFDMYERLDSAANVGSGLGLAISKRLLEMMGGEISVDSAPGQGSDFQFTLPLKKALHREQDSIRWVGLRGLRVWVQDDHHTMRLSLAHYFEAWQVSVVEMDTRHDLQACLEDDFAGPRPDIIVVGLRAANANDPALKALLASCRSSEVPVLTLVTSIDPDIHTALEQAGASASAAKSINRLQLYRHLCELSGTQVQTTAESKPPLTGFNILLADNSAAARGYLAALLTGLGAGVAQVEDGDAAVEAWRKGNFPLVLLDDQMPRLSGGDAAAQIREIAASESLPVLIGITADSRTGVHRRLIRAGMNACLIKPFDEQQLLRCLQTFLPKINPAIHIPQSKGARAGHLLADPQMAILLERELPQQFNAVRAALSRGDSVSARAEIHTLHGTAAFYGLSELKAVAMRIETSLQRDQKAAPEELQALQSALEHAVQSLRVPAES